MSGELTQLAQGIHQHYCFLDEQLSDVAELKPAFDEGRILDNLAHPNQARYGGQQIFVIEIDDYVYLVPYVEDEVKIFLKTIIPSRKATKLYLKGEQQ